MSKVYIDGYFLSQKVTGVQRYAKEFIENMIACGYQVVVMAPANAKQTVVGAEVKRSRWFKGLLWQQIILPVLLLLNGRPPLLSLSGIGPVFYRKKILAIHDASLYRYPDYFSLGYRLFYRILYPVSIFFSKALLTVSEFSKSELLHFIKARKKIYVIYNINSDLTSPDPLNVGEVLPQGKYILTVGSLDKRKNLARTIEAFQQTTFDEPHTLVVAGGNSASFSAMKTEVNDKRILFTGYISDSYLTALYKNAQFFVYLTIYEGFGIPPLEALSNGCPVLLSDIPVFREIYGERFVYADPYDTTLLGLAMQNMSEADREQLYNKQKSVVERFTRNEQIKQIEFALNGAFGEKNITIQ